MVFTAPAHQNQVIFPHLAPKHRSGQAENGVSHQAKPFVPFLALLREHNPDCFALDQGFIAHQLSETPWGLTLMPSLLFPYVTLSYTTLGSYKYLPSRIRTPPQEDQYFSRGLEAEAESLLSHSVLRSWGRLSINSNHPDSSVYNAALLDLDLRPS